MRKIVALLFCSIIILVFLSCEGSILSEIPFAAQSYKTDQRSKTIHVVYDDSVSLIWERDINEYRDRWGQAKYAMEVFAAMLEEKDTMRVYFLSDFDVLTAVPGSLNAPAKITISGTELSGTRVEKIHNTITRAANTPYDAVAKAYADLKNETADEKWLVVLSDGEFNQMNGRVNENVDVEGFFSQYVSESDVKIILLAMGDEVVQIKPDANRGIYFEHARNDDEILGKLTSLCNRIFNRNKLQFTNEGRREFTFDIPMIELLIFAQGTDIKINGIKGVHNYSPSETVNVRYSDVAATNFANDRNVIVSRNLSGTIASFRNVPKGNYSVDMAGNSTTVEIYYKPVVNIDIRLLKGSRRISAQEIAEGQYRVQYGIVDQAGKFFESSLLGNVDYYASVENGGRTVPIKSGETINVQQGDLKINVLSRFLDINTAEKTIIHRVVPPKTFQEHLRDFIKERWYIFWPLVFLLLALLLYLLLWAPKKRFPKYMSKKPSILVEQESGTIQKWGTFEIDSKTKWLPLCPETGKITAVVDGKPLPCLEVKAAGNERMEFTNTEKFSPSKLGGAEFFINDQQLPEGSSRKKEIKCTARIKTVYYNAGSATTYTCSFVKKGKNRKK